MTTTLLTREQAVRIANECDDRGALEAIITGEGGDLQVALLDDAGTEVAKFVLTPAGDVGAGGELLPFAFWLPGRCDSWLEVDHERGYCTRPQGHEGIHTLRTRQSSPPYEVLV